MERDGTEPLPLRVGRLLAGQSERQQDLPKPGPLLFDQSRQREVAGGEDDGDDVGDGALGKVEADLDGLAEDHADDDGDERADDGCAHGLLLDVGCQNAIAETNTAPSSVRWTDAPVAPAWRLMD